MLTTARVCLCVFFRSQKVKTRSYRSCPAFERDLALVVNNCRDYNEPESGFSLLATELETWGLKLFEHLRNFDMLPPDEEEQVEEEQEQEQEEVAQDESTSSDSSDDDLPADAADPCAGWRQSAAAFLPGGQHPGGGQADAAAVGLGDGQHADWGIGGGVGSSSSSDNSSDDSDSSDDGEGGAIGGGSSWATSGAGELGELGGGAFAAAAGGEVGAPPGVSPGRPRFTFTLGPKAASAPGAQW